MSRRPPGCLHYRSLVPDPRSPIPWPSASAHATSGPPTDAPLTDGHPIDTSATVADSRIQAWTTALRAAPRRRSAIETLVMAVLAFAPMLASRPGTVTDDTKTYLYLDPGRYVRQAVSLWDPNVALGTVTHENIGYLLPMGPFYWVFAELHVPLWVAQRLWMGVILFAAGTGMLCLCRTVGLHGPGRYVATLAFTFTPYVLQYAGRISVILLPWAGLPWMVAFVILALRRGGWRYPALFALVVALVSGINASSILYVGIAPALWLPYSVLVAKNATWRQAWSVTWKIGLLSSLVSLWWAAGLQVEAAYGVNVLKYTETVPATSSTSLASEVLRGLGYWYFYGSDRVGVWTQTSIAYSQNLWLVALSFAVPALSFVGAVMVRWRHRAYFALVVVVGTVLSVGAYPYTHPSGIGSLLKALMVDTTAGLAMRSTDRASPLVILSLAMFLGAGITAVWRRVHRTGVIIGAFGAAAVMAAATPLWSGGIVANGSTQPARPPSSVRQAAQTLNAIHPGTRVYALPGNNFAAYRWGNTIDTVYPGLLTRPFVTHEQQIMGSLPTADMLTAIDTPLQNGVMNWNALAPMASLMSAGDVLVQYDQAFEHYDTPNPQQLAADLSSTPTGLSHPRSYGAPRPNISLIPYLDEAALALPPNAGWPSPLVSYTVANPRPVIRAESLRHPLVVDGNASGIVSAASVGLLAGNPTILYAGTLDQHPALRATTLAKPADLVVTDTNRKQGFQWNSLSQNTGYTETAAQPPSTNPADEPINLFPHAPPDAQTTAIFQGISSVTASSYGSSLTYLPEDQPAAALDANLQTAWLDNSFVTPIGQWWQVTMKHPSTPESVTLVQPQTGDPNQWITKVTLTFDGRHPMTVALNPASRQPGGQTITIPAHRFATLRITVDATGRKPNLGVTTVTSSVGFAEVTIPGVHAGKSISMPQDLLRAAGTASLGDRLTLIMTRLRSSGFPPRSATEPTLARTFWLPTARTFTLSGSARISALIPDDMIDRLVGRPGANHTGIVAYSRGRLPGDLKAGAIATLGGNPGSVWEPGFGASHQAGSWLEYNLPSSISFDHLNLQVVADGRHSVPTALTITAGNETRQMDLPSIADSSIPGSVVDVPLTFPTITGRNIRLTFTGVRIENTLNYYSRSPLAMPIAIAAVGIPGLHASPVPSTIPATCRNDLLAVDGRPIWVSVSGTSAAALGRHALNVSLCGPDAGGLPLAAGTHSIQSANGQATGFNIDQLTLDSAPGGGPEPIASGSMLTPPPVTNAPLVHVVSQSKTSMHLTVTGVPSGHGAHSFELVLGQSVNAGWTAAVVGGQSLGAPVLVDGYANGWRVSPSALRTAVHHGTIDVVLRWPPQQGVDVALVISALSIVACVVLALVPRRRRRRRLHRRTRGFVHPDFYAGTSAVGTSPGTTGTVTTGTGMIDDGASPILATPFGAEGGRAPLHVTIIVAVVTGLVAGAIAAPVTGVAVAALTALALVVPRARTLLGIAAAGLVIAAGAVVVVRQGIEHFPAGGSWPTHFGVASALAWAAVAFLGADVTVEVVRRRTRPATAPVVEADSTKHPDPGPTDG